MTIQSDDPTYAATAPRRQGRVPDRVVAFISDTGLADSLSRLADGQGIAAADVLPGGLPGALTDVPANADVLVLEIDDIDHGVETLSRLADRTAARLVAFGHRNDINIYRRLCDAGAADYLVPPFDDAQLLDALKIPAGRTGREGPTPVADDTRLTVILGCRGGIGASGLAVSAAWHAAEELGRSTALVDLDLIFGTATLALDLMPGRGLREALEHPERIDPLFIGSAMINATERLFVLGAEEDPGIEFMTTPDALERLIDAVGETVDAMIVDLPRVLVPGAQPLLARADEIVLVSDLSLSGLRDAIRLRALCRQISQDLSITLVAMAPATGPAAVERKDFERAYEGAVDWVVPLDPKAAAAAAGAGKPICTQLKRKHTYRRATADIAERAVPASGDAADAGRKKRRWLW